VKLLLLNAIVLILMCSVLLESNQNCQEFD